MTFPTHQDWGDVFAPILPEEVRLRREGERLRRAYVGAELALEAALRAEAADPGAFGVRSNVAEARARCDLAARRLSATGYSTQETEK